MLNYSNHFKNKVFRDAHKLLGFLLGVRLFTSKNSKLRSRHLKRKKNMQQYFQEIKCNCNAIQSLDNRSSPTHLIWNSSFQQCSCEIFPRFNNVPLSYDLYNISIQHQQDLQFEKNCVLHIATKDATQTRCTIFENTESSATRPFITQFINISQDFLLTP